MEKGGDKGDSKDEERVIADISPNSLNSNFHTEIKD